MLLSSKASAFIFGFSKLFTSSRNTLAFLPSHKMSKSSISSISENMVKNNAVIVIAGATSAGKSAVSMELCRMLGGNNAEIVIADAVQVYNKLDIGANKPSVEEQGEVPHHLINIANTTTHVIDAAEFSKLAARAIVDILERKKIPIVVGGSTMWIQWLVQGIPDAPKADAAIAEKAERLLAPFELNKDWEGGKRVLENMDSQRAQTLSSNDWYRLRRYLEVALTFDQKNDDVRTSTRASSFAAAAAAVEYDEEGTLTAPPTSSASTLVGTRELLLHNLDVRTFFLSEDRDQLYNTIDERCVAMIRNGLFEEVAVLLKDNVFPLDHPATKAIGYRQTIDFLCDPDNFRNGNERAAVKQYLSEFATATRNYAKRQIAWYRKDPTFMFLEIFRSNPVVAAATSESMGVVSEKGENDKTARTAAVEKEDCDGSTTITNTSKYAPYRKVAREILHWTGDASREEFIRGIDAQVVRARYVEELRKKKNIGRQLANNKGSVSVTSVVEQSVLQWMLHTGELSVSPADTSASAASAGENEVTRGENGTLFSLEELIKSSPFDPPCFVRAAAAETAASVVEKKGVKAGAGTGIRPAGAAVCSTSKRTCSAPDYDNQWSAEGVDIRVHEAHPPLNQKKKKYFTSRLAAAAAVVSPDKEAPADAEMWSQLQAEAQRWRAYVVAEAPEILEQFFQAKKASQATAAATATAVDRDSNQ